MTDKELKATMKAIDEAAQKFSYSVEIKLKALHKTIRNIGKATKKVKKFRNLMKYYRMMEFRKPKKVRR